MKSPGIGFVLSTAALAFAFGIGLSGPAKAQGIPESDDAIKLAINEWTGQHITTHIAGETLKKMGYDVEYVTAGYFPQFTALREGNLTATLEIWTNNVGEHFDSAISSGNVVSLGAVGVVGYEGWAYPKHMEEQCPGLPAFEALAACAELFSSPDTYPSGRLIDYPSEWGGNADAMIAAMNIDYVALPSGSEGAMAAELKSAAVGGTAALVRWWTPHWLEAELDLGWVELPEYEPACDTDPAWGLNPDAVGDCNWAVVGPAIYKAVWVGMKDKWPAAYAFLEDYRISNEIQIPLMQAVDSEGRDIEDAIAEWMDENVDLWKGWIDEAGM